MRDGRQARAVDLSCMISGGAFEGSMGEGLFLRFACRAKCGLVECNGGVQSKMGYSYVTVRNLQTKDDT